MRFEENKYYEHNGGGMIHTLLIIDTTMYGKCIAVERHDTDGYGMTAVGYDSDDYAENWFEITEEAWEASFISEGDK